MKLKYYLRGVGIGIIFATLVMTVSSFVHKNNISDEYIIKEATKLGMVMKDELDNNNGLWGNDDTEEPPVTEDTQESENSEPESETQAPVTPESPVEPEPPVEQAPPVEPEQPVDPEPPVSTDYVTIVIERGDYARQVAEKMKAAGLVPDAEEFRKYIGDHGYGQDIKVGSHNIPVGASFEEICKIITGR